MADIFDQAAGKQGAPTGDIFDQAATPRNASEMLPHPEAVDRAVTAAARAYVVHGMEQLGGVPPGPAAPPALPVPWETDLQFNNPSAKGDIPQQLLNTMFEGAGRAAQGVEHMAAPGGRAKAGGLHQVISGGFDLATPAVMAGGVTAPIKTAITVGAAMAAQKGTTVGLKYLGLPEEYADVAGDLVGLVAGAVAHGKVSRTAIRGEVEPLLKERAAQKATVPKQEYTITGQPVGDIFDKAAGAPPSGSEGGGGRSGPAEQPALAEAPGNGEPRLPRGLAGAKPRYNYGPKAFTLTFESDLDKAAYITAQKTRSASDQKFVDFVRQHTGLEEAAIRARGAEVRARIKGLAKDAEPGALSVPATAVERAAVRPSAAEAPKNKEYFRGDWNIPMNEAGRQQVGAAAERNAGQFDEIHSGTKDRHVETAGTYAAANPEATQAPPNPAFDPMHMGVHEGEEVTPARLDQVNDHIRLRPDEPIPGVGQFSHSPGEAPRAWSSRLIGAVQDVVGGWKPGEKKLIVTSGRDVQAVRAWVAKGMPADRAVDPDVLTARWETQPGEMMRLDPRTGKTENVDQADEDGIYFARHGETDGNDNSAVPAEIRSKSRGAEVRPMPTPAERGPGWVGNVPTSEIKVDAPRFQFKANVGQGGAGDELRGVTNFDPEKAGIISVWKDPADGKTYVVNGHHRVELAQRAGAPEMTVRYLNAEDAQQARIKGAMINIAEGRGESTDAAKIFRESGYSAEELQREGVSVKGKVAKEGLALSRLAQPIFDDVIDGSLTPARGAVIGSGVEGHADQKAVYDLIKQQERNGKRLTNDQVEELIRLNNRTATKTESTADDAQGSMFGVEEMTRSLLPEKAVVSDYVRKQLGQEKKLFGTVGTEAAAARLGEGGNVINAAENAQVADRANRGMLLYDKLSSKAGPIDGILDRAAQRIANGENANDAKQQAYRDIRAHVLAQADQLAGVPQRDAGRAEGHGGEGTPAADGARVPQAASEVAAQPQSNDSGSTEEPPPEKVPTPEQDSAVRQFWGEELGASNIEQVLAADAREAAAMLEKRRAALAELEKAKATPGERKFGQRTIEYFTGERDMWGARVNQVIARLRKLVPDVVDQEALSLMRDFKHKPQELAQFLDGTHPAYQELLQQKPLFANLPGSPYTIARERIEQLRPAILRALNPTPRMLQADGVLNKIAAGTLAEGQKLGILESRWTADEYNPHILHPKGEGELPTQQAGDRMGRAIGGKMGRYFAFAEKREFPTLLDAVINNYRPKTLNAFDAFTIHGDKFATARATHLLTRQLGDMAMGTWGVQKNAPEGWVPLAPHANEFRNLVGYTDEFGLPAAAEQRLFVPPYIADALKPITDPDYMGRVPVFRAMRMTQAYQKAVQLGLSFFHAYTENLMSLANAGPKGWVKALRADMDSPEFQMAERRYIGHGLTSAIQGRTYEAYRALQPGSIPTWSEIWRRAPVVHEMDQVAGKITEFTFGNLQRRFKVTDMMLHEAAWLGKHPNATAAEHAAALHSMAKEINAVYGGLHPELLGVSRSTTEIARALMLAPDWTFSNVFNLKYAMEKGTPAGQMARKFWIRTLVGGMAATQAMSLLMSGKPSKNPTQVYYGTDRDGREIYQNVFFKGASGDVINLVHNVGDYGAVQGLARSIAGKAAPIPRAGIQIATNRDYLGREIVPKGMNAIAGTVRAGAKTAEALLPIPFTVQNMYSMLLGPDAGKYKSPEFLTTTFAGNPPRHVAPEGTRMTKTGLKPAHEKARRSILEEIESGKR